MAEWISVKDRLPKHHEFVIAATKTFYGGLLESEKSIVTRFDEKRGFEFWDKEGRYFVTHWMPLPEPPKGE